MTSLLPFVLFTFGQARPVEVTIHPDPRQTFRGFGASLINWLSDYQKLNSKEQFALSSKLWKDLNFRQLRLWANLEPFAPEPGKRDLTQFRTWYVSSGIVRDARRLGVRTLLLAPAGVPSYLRQPRPDGGENLKAGAENEYATLVADFIQKLRNEDKVVIDVTGIQNEPNDGTRFLPGQMAIVVRDLRAELDRRGLKGVGLIAPETASVDSSHFAYLDALQADPLAWSGLRGVASHSYNMAATEEAGKRTMGREYWMTEASDNGPEEPGDLTRAASLASRVINDLNHGVTHWIHFVGFENPDPKDDATRIFRYETNPLRITTFQKFYTYGQLSKAFPPGSAIRHCTDDLDGEMTYTYGKKPGLNVVAALTPGRGFSIAISNFTSPSFNDQRDSGKWEIDQTGPAARRYEVHLNATELQNRTFRVFRSQTNAPPREDGTVTFKNGKANVSVGPLELVTLRG